MKSPGFMRVCAGCANRNEVTAYTDPENEAILQNSMDAVDALTKEKTIIMIAHRLKTVRHTSLLFASVKTKNKKTKQFILYGYIFFCYISTWRSLLQV